MTNRSIICSYQAFETIRKAFPKREVLADSCAPNGWFYWFGSKGGITYMWKTLEPQLDKIKDGETFKVHRSISKSEDGNYEYEIWHFINSKVFDGAQSLTFARPLKIAGKDIAEQKD